MTAFDDKLGDVYNDRQSGSAAVLAKLIGVISDGLENKAGNEMAEEISVHLPEMKEKLSHFLVIDHFLERLAEAIDASGGGSYRLKSFINNYRAEWDGVNARISARAIENINLSGKTILLHSNSSAIIDLFENMKQAGISARVVQTESRPECEGLRQAEAIAKTGCPVTLIVDSAISLFLPEVDLFLTGADQIHPKYFVNKTGTYPLAMMCKKYGIPVYVLADSRKIRTGEFNPEDLKQPRQPAREVWDVNIENIAPVNFYFESIPCAFVEAFFTESRSLVPGEL